MASVALKHLAVVVPGFGASDSDWCIPAVSTWIKALSTSARIDVFCLQYPRYRGEWCAFGATVRGYFRPGRGGGVRPIPAVLWDLATIHRRDPFHEVIGVWAEESGLTAVLAGRLLQIPSQVIVAGVELASPGEVSHHRPWRRRLARGVLHAADEVVAPSRWMASKIARPTRVVPWRVDPHLFKAEPRVSRGQRLLCVASLVPSKGVMDLLAALEQVHLTFPQVSLDIVGEGPQRPELEQRGKKIPHVHFRGAVPYLQMPDIYRQYDVLIHPSYWEAQGMVIDEALACGLKVVATRVGRGLDLSPEEGISVEPGDIPALIRAILEVLGGA